VTKFYTHFGNFNLDFQAADWNWINGDVIMTKFEKEAYTYSLALAYQESS
jgi:hypothetical protein